MNSLVDKCRGLTGTGDDATNANAIPPVPFPRGRGCKWFRHPVCACEPAHRRAQHCEKMGTGLHVQNYSTEIDMFGGGNGTRSAEKFHAIQSSFTTCNP